MTAEKAHGIVIRCVDFSETSSIAAVFTREFGRISGLAKGARRAKGPFDAGLDLLSICRLVFLRKSGDSLNLFTEAKLERRFRPPRERVDQLYGAYYVAELLRGLTADFDPHPALYDAAAATLNQLRSPCLAATVVLRFELALLHELGLAPEWNACVACGTKVQEDRPASVSIVGGGVVCARCRVAGSRVRLSAAAMSQLRLAQRAELTSSPLAAPRRVAGECRGFMNHVMAHYLEGTPRLAPYLAMLSCDSASPTSEGS